MRNELIDLIDDAMNDWDDVISECQENGEVPPDSFEEHIADYLMANGVTIQRWISVEERFPTEEDTGENKSVIVRDVLGRMRVVYFEFVRLYKEEFTHWMSFPSVDGLE